MNRHHLLRALALVVVAAAPTALAQPITCAFAAGEPQPFLGESFSSTVSIGRGAAGTAYAPAFEVMVPPNLTLTAASGLGQALTLQSVGTFPGTAPATGTLTNPLTREVVTGPGGFRLFLVRYPLSGLNSGIGTQTATLTFQVASSPTSLVGTPLTPQVTCLFAFGLDALNNPSTDAPIRSDVRTSGTDQTTTTVTPSYARLRKSVAPSVTVTGPTYEAAYAITLDVATGVTVTGAQLRDVVPDGFQVTAVTTTAGTITSPSPLPPSTPGGTIVVSVPSVTGVASAPEVVVTVRGYVPETAAGGGPVLSACSNSSASLTANLLNGATLTGGSVGATPLNLTTPRSAALQGRAEVLRESITNVSPGAPGDGSFRPGDIGEITLQVQISDYYTFTNGAVRSQLGPGVRFVPGSASLNNATVAPQVSLDGRTIDLTGVPGLASSTSTIRYRFTVEETYDTTGLPLHGGDVIPTGHMLSMNLGACLQQSTEAQSGGDASIRIGTVAFTKSIASINGVAPSGPVTVRPGDVVVFRLDVQQRAGDQTQVVLSDFLPAPIFNAQQYGPNIPFGPGLPARFGPGSSPFLPTPVVTATSLAADNAVTITFPAINTTPTQDLRIVLELEFTVTSAPREDGLAFTNVARVSLNGTGSVTTTGFLVAAFVDSDPNLVLTTGFVAASSTSGGAAKPGVTYAPAAINPGPFTNVSLAATPVQNDVTGVDANDNVTFRTVVRNSGSAAAFDVNLSSDPPAGLGTCGVTSVTNGNGVALSAVLGLTPTGWTVTLTDPLPASTAAAGTNVAVITGVCVLPTTGWRPNDLLTHAVGLTNYASTPGGANFVAANFGTLTDSATLRFANIGLSQTNATTPVVVRDTIAYTVNVSFPEGEFSSVVLTDSFPASLALGGSAPTLVLPAGVTASGSLVPVVNATGTQVQWSLGTVTNSNSDDAVEAATPLALTAVVLNSGTQAAGATITNPVTASVQGTQVSSSNSQGVQFREPLLVANASVAPSTVAGGGTVTLTTTLALATPAANQVTAHDVRYVMTVPSSCASPAFGAVTGVTGGAGSVAGNDVIVTIPSIAVGQTATITLSCTVPTSITVGTTTSLPARIEWTSQPGTPAQLGPNTAAVERTGTGTPADNDYFLTPSTTLTIAPIAIAQARVGSGGVPVGGFVDYTLTLTVPTGTTGAALTMTEALDPGLVFVSTAGFSASSGLTCGGAACALPTPTVTNGGRTIAWALGTVVNPDPTAATLSFTVRAVVDNVAASVRGATLNGRLQAGALTTPAVPVTVVEPVVAVTAATLAPASGNAGDVFTFSSTLSTTAPGGNLGTAHDVALTAALPSGLEAVPGTYASSTCPAPASQTLMGATIALVFSALAPSTTCVFTLQVRMTDVAVVGASLSLTGGVRWTSLAGETTSNLSPFSTTSRERTGNTMDPGGALNAYAATGSSPSVSVSPAAWSVTKSLLSTSSTATAGGLIAAGEEVTYQLRVTVAEGVTAGVVVSDSPPAGLQLVSVALSTAGFAGAVGVDPTSANLGLAAGAAGSFSLGTVTNPGNNLAADDSFTLTVVARAVFGAALAQPNALNQASVTGSGPLALGASSVPVTFGVPRPTIAHSLAPASPAPGGIVSGTVTIANTGSGPVCEPVVTVTAPAGFSFASPSSDGLDNDQDGVVDEAGEASLVGSALTIAAAGCIAGAGSLALPYRVVADAAVTPTPVSMVAELVGYRTLPAPSGVALTPTTDLFDNNQVGGTDEVTDGRVSTSLTPAAPRLVFTKLVTDLNGAPLQPGDTLEYAIAVQNTGTGPTTGVVVTDPLPTAVATIVAGSATTSQGTVSLAGSTLTATVGTVAASSTVTVRVRLAVPTTVTTAVSLSNQASLATSDAYGNRVSDDPSTSAVDDATVLAVSSGLATPVITAPANNSRTGDSTPTVTGTAPPNATVLVFFDGATTPACTATASPTGAWSCEPMTPLSEGAHTVAARAVDGGGNSSFLSPSNTFTVDLTAPTVAISSPAQGSRTTQRTPTITGTAEAGTSVAVTLDGASSPLCTITADPQGAWSCPVPMPLSDGPHTVAAVSTDAAGNASPRVVHGFTVDTTPPKAPSILGPSEGAITNATPTFSGTGEPGSTIEVLVDGSSIPACTALVDALGTWACVATSPLPEGPRSALARAEDAAGNASNSPVRGFTVEAGAAPLPPVITGPRRDARLSDSTPTIEGQATPGSLVTVFVDGAASPTCTATADATGRFSCDVPSALADGAHGVIATSTTTAGTSPASAPVPFVIDTAAPAAPAITEPLANAVTGPTPRYAGTAEPGATVEVLVDGAAVVSCAAVADATGAWACQQPGALSTGAHVVVARAVDAAGNVGPQTPDRPFSVAAGQPPVAVLTVPSSGAHLGTTTPTFRGLATPGATVRVFVDGAASPACTALADDAGHFACVAIAPLAAGAHTATVTAESASGASPPGAAVPFVIDVVAPGAPVVTAPADGAVTSPVPSFAGTAEPGSRVIARVDGQVLCVVTADVMGAWSCPAPRPLATGPHAVDAQAIDEAGNTSPSSNLNRFTVAALPVAPTIEVPANGAATPLRRPDFRGAAEPGSSVEVLVDGAVVCTTTATAQGRYECTSTVDLSIGAHTAVARATNVTGTTPSMPSAFTIFGPPPVPTLDAPTDGAEVRTRAPTFEGRAEPGSAVEVVVDGAVACTATAGADGRFSCESALTLEEGERAVLVRATNAAGTTSSATTRFVVQVRDLDGDGVVDGVGLTGGGCSAMPGPAWLGLGVLALLRWRRRSAVRR
jgi:uncharacterized repeat protein (TIGR01451 family)